MVEVPNVRVQGVPDVRGLRGFDKKAPRKRLREVKNVN
jgi:hypothetical protein